MLCGISLKSELVSHTHRDHVIVVNRQRVVIIQLVDFVINESGHIFVEVVCRAQLYVFNPILVAVSVDVFTLRLQVSYGRTQTEVELVLSDYFKVLRFVAKPREPTRVAL